MATSDKELLFTFSLDSLDTRLDVVRFEGREGISQLFFFDITLVSDDPDIDLDAALKSSAVLTLHSRDHTRTVPYRGMLSTFEQLGRVDHYYFYRATLVPRLWKAGLNRLNEVYLLEQRVPELLVSVLERNGLSPDIELRLKNPETYRPRSFVCQYQESDLNFVSRWMERLGLYYIFDHDRSHSGEFLYMMDHKAAQPAETLTLRYTPPEDVQTDRQDESVTALTCRKTHLPGAALVQDFNYRQADEKDTIVGEEPISQGTRGTYNKFMMYGQNLRSKDEASQLARVRAEGFDAQGTVFHGQALAMGIRSGYFLALTNHFRPSFNTRYLVTEVTHEGSQAGVVLAGQNTAYNQGEHGSRYECEFQAISADLQYRAPLRTPRPTIGGVLTALIDAEGTGETAELNEYGQYKVQLMYDYTPHPANKASSWLRMATPYQGRFEGMHFPLRKDTEVLLAFNEGDPDQPVILGAVPNSENPSIAFDQKATHNGFRTATGNAIDMLDNEGRSVIGIYSPIDKSVFYIGDIESSQTGEEKEEPAASEDNDGPHDGPNDLITLIQDVSDDG